MRSCHQVLVNKGKCDDDVTKEIPVYMSVNGWTSQPEA